MRVDQKGAAGSFLRGAGLGHYGWLLSALLCVVCIAPIFHEYQLGPRIGDLVIALVTIAGVCAVMRSINQVAWVILLAGGAIGSRAVNAFWEPAWTAALAEALTLMFLSCVFVIILRDVFRSNVVSIDTLVGSLCGYLVLAMIFASIYTFLIGVYPHSLLIALTADSPPAPVSPANFGLPAYFSIITLTAVGFGDVVPNHPFVRSVASLEAIIGQAYLAVIVARLVGMHLLDHAASSPSGRSCEQQPVG